MNGVLVIDKPKGMTSHDVVNVVRRVAHTKSVGHAGTLDPMATGVLVVAVGSATKLIQYLKTDPKEYRAEVTFGLSTDTDDVTGEILSDTDASGLDATRLEALLSRFSGAIEQLPPAYSAIKVRGEALYKAARRGEKVEVSPRRIEVYELELVDFSPGEKPVANLRVLCSAGTYIRSLARDLGDALGVGGTLSKLTRTRSGEFGILQSVGVAELRESESWNDYLLDVDQVLSYLPSIRVRESAVFHVSNGRPIQVADLLSADPVGFEALARVLDERGRTLAIARITLDLQLDLHSEGQEQVIAKPVKVLKR